MACSWQVLIPNVTLQASLLDRLIDPESDGTGSRPGCTVEQMIDSVRRDLEDLLNTHRTLIDIPGEYPETENSILTYGLPDFSSFQSSKPTSAAGGRADRAGDRPVRAPAPERPGDADRGARREADEAQVPDPRDAPRGSFPGGRVRDDLEALDRRDLDPAGRHLR